MVFSRQATFFRALGNYRFAARKPGFLEVPDGAGDSRARANEVTIELLPEAIIRGRVLITNASPRWA